MTTMATTDNNTPDVHTSKPELILNAENGSTFGMAETDTDNWAELNPAPDPGTEYLVWRDGDTTTKVGTALVEPGSAALVFFTHTELVRTEGGLTRRMCPNRIRADEAGLRWVPAKAERPVALVQRELANRLAVSLAEELEKFNSMNDDLNELADSWGCCEDYETVVVPLGLRGRDKKKDYDVTVKVTVKYTDDSPSHNADLKLREVYGLYRLETTELTFTGTFELTVHMSECTSDGDAMNMVTREDVDDALASVLTGDYEIHGWEADSAVESD